MITGLLYANDETKLVNFSEHEIFLKTGSNSCRAAKKKIHNLQANQFWLKADEKIHTQFQIQENKNCNPMKQT